MLKRASNHSQSPFRYLIIEVVPPSVSVYHMRDRTIETNTLACERERAGYLLSA